MKTETLSITRASGWRKYVYGIIASEITRMVRFYDRTFFLSEKTSNHNFLQEQISGSLSIQNGEDLPDPLANREDRIAVVVNGNFNYNVDIELELRNLKSKLNRFSRLVVVTYNPYLSWLYRFANWLNIREGDMPSTFLTHTDYENLAKLADFELIRSRPVAFVPWSLLGLGSLLNRILPATPFLRNFALANVLVFRPIREESIKPSLSIVIPARNEKGNIENALKRMPDLGTEIEIIFIEGHSSDQTWEEILRVQELYKNRFKIQSYQQTGKGKNDAVRLGFSKATGDLLTILDADLTMPPELLGRFYEAYCGGKADFINGTRLVYPMEGNAMRFLNRLGNVFFAKALSWVLDTRLADSLCGTKMISRRDYERVKNWREHFGDFDPFGDFELLFPAAILGFGIVDIPIRYRARTYGETNISRFQHGLLLLRMTLVGFFRVKLGSIRN